jgi:hypothetical protein
MAVTIGIQSLFGFIAWPILSPSPFGPGNFDPVLYILLGPTALMVVAPYLEYRRTRAAIQMRAGISLAAEAEADVVSVELGERHSEANS